MYYILLLCLILFGQPAIAAEPPLKILFMVNMFPTLSATFVMGQIKGMIDKGHDVHVFAQYKSSMKKMHPDIEHYKLLAKTYYKDLPKDIRTYDILYCQFFSLGNDLMPKLMQIKAKSRKFPKFLVCCRGSDGVEGVSIRNKRCQALFNSADLFMPVCQHFENLLLKAGCDKKKIIVHHSAIDLKLFDYTKKQRKPGQEVTLLSVGRLTESKGTLYALEAFAVLEKKFPMLRYVIVGNGACRDQLTRFVHEHKLEDKVTFVGWCLPHEVMNWLSKADIFVHPSIRGINNAQEGVPNVLMEAMAMGLPVVSTWHGGIPEIVTDGYSGFLVPEKNSAILADKIRQTLESQSDWQQIGSIGRACIEKKYEINKENAGLEEILYQVIKGRSSS
jgi:colanic acid/amylovoran biosynthesis glycosyltransferase